MYQSGKDIITKLGYAHLFEETVGDTLGWGVDDPTMQIQNKSDSPGDRTWIEEFNRKGLEKSIERFKA